MATQHSCTVCVCLPTHGNGHVHGHVYTLLTLFLSCALLFTQSNSAPCISCIPFATATPPGIIVFNCWTPTHHNWHTRTHMLCTQKQICSQWNSHTAILRIVFPAFAARPRNTLLCVCVCVCARMLLHSTVCCSISVVLIPIKGASNRSLNQNVYLHHFLFLLQPGNISATEHFCMRAYVPAQCM
jgi:chorismate mutase